MKILQEVRVEDDLYFKGPFWVISDSIDSILTGKYNLLCNKSICSYDGKLDRTRPNRKNETHEAVWELYKSDYNNVDYKYYPRGRVEIYNGVAYININSILNNPNIIDKIRLEYGIEKLDYKIGLNDLEQGSHYDFGLR